MSAMAVLASKCRLGSTTTISWRTWGTVSAGDFFSQPTPQPNQEVMRQQAQGQVVVPADPAAHFVVVHAQVTLAFQDGPLDRPAHPTDPDQSLPRRLRRCVGRIGLHLSRTVQRPSHTHPEVRA